MRTISREAPLTNEELSLVHKYLMDKISRQELSAALGRTRTNTYYYIGRAMFYWFTTGILVFKDIKRKRELGGSDLKGGRK